MHIKLHNDYVICNTGKGTDNLINPLNPIKDRNYYANFFNNEPHWIWICTIDNDYCIMCVLKKPEYIFENSIKKYIHVVVLIDKDGQKLFNIAINKPYKSSVEAIFKQQHVYNIKNKLFKNLIPTIEQNYSNYIKNMCIGVILIKQNQNTRNEWINNTPTQNFLEFVDLLGKKIDLNNWNGYRGNMGINQTIIYNHWKGIVPIVYHVAPFLSREDIRQLIGNDLLIILYVETDENDNDISLDLSKLDRLGKFPHCFAIVYKKHNNYILRLVTKTHIPNKLPYNFVKELSFSQIEEVMLNKFYGVMNHLHKYDTFSKMYTVPRQTYINTLINSLDIKKIKLSDDIELNKNNNDILIDRADSYSKISNLFEKDSFICKMN